MMVEKADLGLSLSLGCSENRQPPPSLQLSLMSSPPSPPPVVHQRPQWSNLLASLASERGSRGREGLAALDVNGSPAAEREIEGEEGEEVAVVSSPNSALSNGSGKRDPGDCAISDEDGEGSRKKLRLSKDQAAVLEESFKEHSTLNPNQKLALARQLRLRPRQVEVWFQNRRARTKLKQTEMDCEYLKRCCENLTAENRRLTKEVAELRALKLSPHLYMQMTPPTTLTMCPSCERVSSSSAAAASPPAETAPASDRCCRLPTPIAPAPAPWSLTQLRASGSCAPSSTVLIRSTH